MINLDDQKIGVVYKIAVILNESALIRCNYNNIMPNIMKIASTISVSNTTFAEDFEFSEYTRNNINELFDETQPINLLNFDALYISTNATSDDVIYESLKNAKKILKEFIDTDKGLFISSQKKLGKLKKDEGSYMDFLPPEYSYSLIIRENKDSSVGAIAIKTKDDLIIKNIPEAMINRRCLNNPFKAHRYRSHIVLQNIDFFTPILVDYSEKNENILFVRCKNKKIVYTSMALDHEEQNELLLAVLNYIIKGKPQIVFIGDMKDKNIKYLYYDFKISKEPVIEFIDFNFEIKNDYSTYIISPNMSKEAVEDFWKHLKLINTNYMNLYHINNNNIDDKILTEYSNHNSIDFIVDQTYSWLTIQFNNVRAGKIDADIESLGFHAHFWSNSFWISHDVLQYMFYLSRTSVKHWECALPFIDEVFNDIALKHYRHKEDDPDKGSYDGVLDCSCAMLELFCLHGLHDSSNHNETGYDNILNIDLTFTYILSKINDISPSSFDLKTAIITFDKIRTMDNIPACLLNFFERDSSESFYALLNSFVEEDLIEDLWKGSDVNNVLLDRLSDVELCKNLNILAIYLKHNPSKNTILEDKLMQILYNIIYILVKMQDNGKWHNVNRTAIVVRTLQEFIVNIGDRINEKHIGYCQNMLTQGINWLVYNYDKINGNWSGDILSTANAAHAIAVYNSFNKFAIKDFKKSIFSNIKKDNQSKVLQQMNDTLNKSRKTIMELMKTTKILKTTEESLREKLLSCDEWKKAIVKKYRFRLRIMITITLCMIVILIIDKFQLFKKFNSYENLISILVSFIISSGIAHLIDMFIKMNESE